MEYMSRLKKIIENWLRIPFLVKKNKELAKMYAETNSDVYNLYQQIERTERRLDHYRDIVDDVITKLGDLQERQGELDRFHSYFLKTYVTDDLKVKLKKHE